MSNKQGVKHVARGEIWDIELNPTRGAEINKVRPCVVVSNDRVGRLPPRVVVPITEWKDSYSSAVWFVRLDPNTENGLTKPSAADAFQVRSVSLTRFRSQRGVVSAQELEDIVAAIAIVVDIGM